MIDARAEDRIRSWSWMYSRIYSDRARLLRYPEIRARALLAVAADRIEQAVALTIETDDRRRSWRRREKLVRGLGMIRRMADGHGLADVVDGDLVRAVGPVDGPLDWRNWLIDAVADALGQPLREVDDLAGEMIRSHERGVASARAYMETLPKPTPRKATGRERAPDTETKPRAPSYDDSGFVRLLAMLPIDMTRDDQRDYGDALLIDPDATPIDEWSL